MLKLIVESLSFDHHQMVSLKLSVGQLGGDLQCKNNADR